MSAFPLITTSSLRLGTFSPWAGGRKNEGGRWRKQARKALSSSLCLAPRSQLIRPAEPFQGLAAAFARERRQAGGPRWGGGWCLVRLARASHGGAPEGGTRVLLIVTPSSTWHEPWARQMCPEQVLGGTGRWTDGGQVCFFLAVGSVSWKGEEAESEW